MDNTYSIHGMIGETKTAEFELLHKMAKSKASEQYIVEFKLMFISCAWVLVQVGVKNGT
jgi:hypothetical protein